MRKNEKGEFVGHRTDAQVDRDARFKRQAMELMEHAGENWAIHGLAVMKRNALARVLYLNDLYQRILPGPGVICEFGVQWGASLATLANLRALHEPYNHSRSIFGFDTFSGFASVSAKDGAQVAPGDYRSTDDHQQRLASDLDCPGDYRLFNVGHSGNCFNTQSTRRHWLIS